MEITYYHRCWLGQKLRLGRKNHSLETSSDLEGAFSLDMLMTLSAAGFGGSFFGKEMFCTKFRVSTIWCVVWGWTRCGKVPNHRKPEICANLCWFWGSDESSGTFWCQIKEYEHAFATSQLRFQQIKNKDHFFLIKSTLEMFLCICFISLKINFCPLQTKLW